MEPNLDIQAIKQSNLSAATIKVRDAVIQKCEGKNLEEMSRFIKQLLEHETNEQKRLGVLAARVYMLREKIAFVLGNEFDDDSADHIKSRHGGKVEGSSKGKSAEAEDSLPEDAQAPEASEWMRVRILKDAEVNHVRFPAGVVIDALTGDAQKLIDAGKAEKITGDDSSGEDKAEAAPEDAPAEETKAEEAPAEATPAEEATAEEAEATPEDTEAAGDDAEKS